METKNRLEPEHRADKKRLESECPPKIKYLVEVHPSPYLELSIRITDEMLEDLKECAEDAKRTSIENGKDCETCSWNEMMIGDTCMCELVTPEMLNEEV